MLVKKSERKTKVGARKRRHIRIRKRLSGTAERPRLLVRKTAKHIYVTVIDDAPLTGARTVLTASTVKAEGNKNKNFSNVTHATKLGKEVAELLKARGLNAVVFDRGGYRYHGCVKALADAVREGGITV